MKKLKEYMRLIRVKHYIKNLLIFLPLIFSGQLLNIDKLMVSIYGFISFSFVTSTIYILNDYKDIEKDRKHPKKKMRPLASKTVSKKEAVIIALLLIIAIVSINVFKLIKETDNYYFIYIELIYLILNVGYSFGLKKIPILDVVILVSGFILRVIFGGIINNIQISNWLYLTVMSGAFYMGFGKRRNELVKAGNSSREVLKKYNKEFLDKFMNMSLTLIIVFYSLWCIDDLTLTKFGNNIVWTIPMILIILMRYSLIISGDSEGDPVEVLTEDKTLLSLCIAFAAILIGVLYL